MLFLLSCLIPSRDERDLPDPVSQVVDDLHCLATGDEVLGRSQSNLLPVDVE